MANGEASLLQIINVVSTPSLDFWLQKENRHCREPSFDHPSWRQLTRARSLLEASLNVNVYSLHGASGALSLDGGR